MDKTKWYKLIDITLFVLCFINLILWILRAQYNQEQHGVIAWVYHQLFQPMVGAIFILPTLVVLSTVNRKITVDSFTFLSLKCLTINVILIVLLK